MDIGARDRVDGWRGAESGVRLDRQGESAGVWTGFVGVGSQEKRRSRNWAQTESFLGGRKRQASWQREVRIEPSTDAELAMPGVAWGSGGGQ